MTEPEDVEQEYIEAIRTGCAAGDGHLKCSYPECKCIQTPRIVCAALGIADRNYAVRFSQSKIASAIMGTPGWAISEPDATNSQIAHRIAREIINTLTRR
jgi:hypothetical protein